jgi:hypothetical protein
MFSILCPKRFPLARRSGLSKAASIWRMGGKHPQPPRVNLMRPEITRGTTPISLLTYNLLTTWYSWRSRGVSFGRTSCPRRAGSGEHQIYRGSAAGETFPSPVLHMPRCKKSQTFALEDSPSQTRKPWAVRPVTSLAPHYFFIMPNSTPLPSFNPQSQLYPSLLRLGIANTAVVNSLWPIT